MYNILNGILKGTDLYYELSKNNKVIFIKERTNLNSLLVKQTDATVSGTVTNAQTGKPMIGVNVLVVGTSSGTVTDVNGHYSLSVPSLQDTLRFSFIGFKTKTVPINGQAIVNVSMNRTVEALSQLVVTGFGKRSRIEFTGSASTVNVQKRINHVPVVNVSNSLMGSVSGLQISRSSGTPGTKTQINIRGISSINANSQPLFVINGVPVSTGNFKNSGDIIDNNSDVVNRMGLLATLNPQSIKSITVLKGPVATAQYGARGSNGVIVITTKKVKQERQRLILTFNTDLFLRQLTGHNRSMRFNQLSFIGKVVKTQGYLRPRIYLFGMAQMIIYLGSLMKTGKVWHFAIMLCPDLMGYRPAGGAKTLHFMLHLIT